MQERIIARIHVCTNTYFFHSRCPEKNIMSAFKYDVATGKAEAKLYSMFKFPESNRVHFQCDILVCNGEF